MKSRTLHADQHGGPIDKRAPIPQLTPMILYVALGGAIGATLRYVTVQAVAFPYGTLTVNVLGSFAMGLAFVWLSAKGPWQPLLMTGVLGGFTTFSAFSLDTLKLLQDGRFALAGGYILASVALSLAAIFAAITLAKGAPA